MANAMSCEPDGYADASQYQYLATMLCSNDNSYGLVIQRITN